MVIIITGATSGLGKATAEYLSKLGHTIYSFSRRIGNDGNIKYLSCDIGNTADIKKSIERVIINEGRIDCLINNAGFGISGSFENNSVESIKNITNVNLIGTLEMCKECLPHLRKTKGRIINISSIAGVLPIPFQTMYSVTKSAIVTFSQSLANELKPFGVKVSCLLPGDFKTDFTNNRKKEKESEEYKIRVDRSISKMEKDEINGMNPEKIAKKIAKLINKKNPPLITTIGFQYKLFLFLNRILPTRLVNFVLYNMYGK